LIALYVAILNLNPRNPLVHRCSIVFREEWLGNFRFIEYRDWSLEKPSSMLVALPDTGLVGVIGASYLISKLGLEEIGGIDSPLLPPIAIVSKGLLRPPIRIFASNRLAIVYTEVSLAVDALSNLTATLIDYARLRGVDSIVGLTGIPKPNRLDVTELTTYYVSSIGKNDAAEKCGAKMLESGVIIGPFAVLMKDAIRKRLLSTLFLTESFMEFPDPEASASGLKIISRFLGIEIDVGGLLEQAEMIRFRARDVMRSATSNLSKIGKELEYGIPLHT